MKFAGDRLRLSASDVANFVACQHMTRLDLLEAWGRLHRPRKFDVGFEDLVQRGEEHERIVLEQFRADGLNVVEINPSPSAETAAAQATREAIRGGADVIYQGVLLGGSPDGGTALLGRPDFLVRADLLGAPDGEPRQNKLHYEVVDAKLARTAKARAVAQTAFYSHLLAQLQGVQPRWMHLALGQGELVPLKVGDYAAYERQARRALSTFIAADPGHNPPADPYPEPVEHCVICRWDDLCQDRRRRDDDLSLVAGITKDQRRTLKASGVSTRRGLASLAVLPGRTQASRDALAGARLQARLQVASEDEGRIRYELLDPERDQAGAPLANRGLLALPEPADGDLFFDIEGARYYSEDNKEFGLQYLFGIVDTADTDARGRPRYTQDLGLRPAGREAGLRGADRLHHRAAPPSSGPARLPLQPLRADVGRPPHRAARNPPGGGRLADGPLRHPRGRGGRPVPPRRVRRPVPGGPAGRPGGRGELLHQAPRTAVRLHPADGPAAGNRAPDRLRGGA